MASPRGASRSATSSGEEPRVGAIATQALANVSYGPRGLDLLRAGRTASDTLEALVEDDPLASRRQVAAVDAALDLRVDDHANPLEELARLERLHFLDFCRPDPASLLVLEGDLADEVERLRAAAIVAPDAQQMES